MNAQTLVVGVGDCKVTADPGVELITYALGSCIAIAIWDPVSHVAGLLHFMLPDSAVDRASGGRDAPYRYADTGTPLLFRSAYECGAEKKRLVVRIAGGAAVFDDGGIFNIGQRNLAALRKILWKAGVLVQGEDVGGSVSRTVRLCNADGRVTVRCPGEPERELVARRAQDRAAQDRAAQPPPSQSQAGQSQAGQSQSAPAPPGQSSIPGNQTFANRALQDRGGLTCTSAS